MNMKLIKLHQLVATFCCFTLLRIERTNGVYDNSKKSCGGNGRDVITQASIGPACMCPPGTLCKGESCFDVGIHPHSEKTGDTAFLLHHCSDCKCEGQAKTNLSCPSNSYAQNEHCVCKNSYHCQGKDCDILDDNYGRVIAKGFNPTKCDYCTCQELSEKHKIMQKETFRRAFSIHDGFNKIINLVNLLEESDFKIYVYPFCPPENIHEFKKTDDMSREEFWKLYENRTCLEDHIRKDGAGSLNTGASTFQSGYIFLHHLIHSPFYTTDWTEATYYAVPQIAAGTGLYKPITKVMYSEIWNKTKGRNHIWFNTEDDAWRCLHVYSYASKELKDIVKYKQSIVNERFVVLTHAGRIPNFGNCYTWEWKCKKSPVGCYDDINTTNEIIIPSYIPAGDEEKRTFGHCDMNREYDVFFRGAMDGSRNERRELLAYTQQFYNITDIRESSYYFGLAPAGNGIWSARIFQLMDKCVVPVISTDGIVLPFERVLNYSQFTVKALSQEYWKRTNKSDFMNEMIEMANSLRGCSSAQEHEDDMRHKCDKKGHELKMKMHLAKIVYPWLSWRARKNGEDVRSPFTLAILELVCKSQTFKPDYMEEYCNEPTSRIATQQYL
eukprot:m.7557 g.7557  ORF g.7557 m.7557 type:complete len:610 (+) comp3735_c0_seq1:189-2018(+)